MADFKEIHQKPDQSSQQFQEEVANWIGLGYHTATGFSDPKGKHSWVMLEKGNQSLSGGKRMISE